MIITISGTPGSGKSTAGKYLAQKLNWAHYSTGGYMRQMALDRGISLQELGDIAKTDKSIDQELDDWQRKIGKEKDHFVIDGRLSFHFIPNSIKIFFDADPIVRAQRILADNRKEESASSLNQMVADMKRRERVEQERYEKYYSINPYDKSKYDLVIDTTNLTPEEVVSKVVKFVKDRARSDN
ncbi:MAG TPA: (d)CMP kinase [Candidatus Nanoarchaeia archaeon]|nr:(d)CMP kinase [Candidatus Nanoarchaeia archaeon]